MKTEETNLNSDIEKATAQCLLTMASKHIGYYGTSDEINIVQSIKNKGFYYIL